MNALLPLLVSLGNTWGLIQIVFFLSHGLVEVPLQLWRQGDFKLALEYVRASPHSEITCTIAKIEEEKLTAYANVQAMAHICRRIAPEIPDGFSEYYQTILNEVHLPATSS